MFGLEILDIAVGLVLTYVLMSLILTSVQEGIEWWFKSRAVDLEQAIGELLQDDDKLVRQFYDHPLIYALYRGKRPAVESKAEKPAAGQSLSGLPSSQLPSYIPRETFSAALIDLLAAGKSNDELARALTGLGRFAGNKPEQLRQELEGWYDAAMDRASGWFKRRTQRSLFLMGLGIAFLLNVNSVMIARQLSGDEQSRVLANQLAEQVARQSTPPSTDAELKAFNDQLSHIGIPLGWDQATVNKIKSSLPPGPPTWGNRDFDLRDLWWPTGWLALFVLLLGYLTTAFAVTLGAPFWFDVLNRIMVIRSTIKPNEKSPDEPSEEGGKKPAADKPAAAVPVQENKASAPANFAAMVGDESDELDGCLDGHAVGAGMATDDVDLPPATGGVARV